jgi:glutathione peroxidase
MSNALHGISFTRMDGSAATLGDYSGSVVLVVNVASKCGLTPQYEGLEKLYEQYRGRGLVVLGFPANDFAGQEPGSNEEIVEFCRGTFGVRFPMAQKIAVTGADTHPLYQQLVAAQPVATANPDSQLRVRLEARGLGPKNPGDVMWNFEKFLIDRNGEVVGRFAPDIDPYDERLVRAIDAELAQV